MLTQKKSFIGIILKPLRSLFIVAVALLSATHSRAQYAYSDGWILPLEGDTIKGHLADLPANKREVKCLFVETLGGVKKVFRPGDIQSYGWKNGPNYYSISIKTDDGETKQRFLRSLTSAPIHVFISRRLFSYRQYVQRTDQDMIRVASGQQKADTLLKDVVYRLKPDNVQNLLDLASRDIPHVNVVSRVTKANLESVYKFADTYENGSQTGGGLKSQQLKRPKWRASAGPTFMGPYPSGHLIRWPEGEEEESRSTSPALGLVFRLERPYEFQKEFLQVRYLVNRREFVSGIVNITEGPVIRFRNQFLYNRKWLEHHLSFMVGQQWKLKWDRIRPYWGIGVDVAFPQVLSTTYVLSNQTEYLDTGEIVQGFEFEDEYEEPYLTIGGFGTFWHSLEIQAGAIITLNPRVELMVQGHVGIGYPIFFLMRTELRGSSRDVTNSTVGFSVALPLYFGKR